MDLEPLAVVLVLAGEGVVVEFVQDLLDTGGGLGKHGLDGHPGGKPAATWPKGATEGAQHSCGEARH